jgi:DNA-binding LacI/PurR family transcriptional regulator
MNTSKIGVVTNDRRRVFQRGLIDGIEACANSLGYSVQVDSIAEDPTHPRPLELPVSEQDGVIVISNALDDATLSRIYATGKPMSLISHCSDTLPIPAIIQNNVEGIYRLVDYLVMDCQRRNLVYVRGELSQHDGKSRDRAFRECIYRHALSVPESHWLKGDFEPEVAADSLNSLVRSGAEFDGLIAADYLMALALLDVLEGHGIRVPNDVCVVGFGDGPEAAEAGLTTVGGDVTELGKRSARQLFAQINGARIQGVTWLNTQVIERRTCCPIRE